MRKLLPAIFCMILEVVGIAFSAPVQASYTVFSNQLTFQTMTGAVSATGPLTSAGTSLGSATFGSITFSAVGPSSLNFGTSPDQWSTLIPGIDLAINATENFNIVSSAPVFAMGFQAHEPSASGFASDTCGIAGPCTDTTFQITIKNGAVVLGTELINFPDNTLAFFGIHSSLAFDRFEVRDLSSTIDDEFFGQVYSGTTPAIPEPETYAMMLAGLGLLGLAARRKKRKSEKA
jgi:hypothetical protein